MTFLDLTVLYHDSMPSRIYLAMLKKSGFVPKKIIHLKFCRGKKYNLIKKIIGENFANKILKYKNKEKEDKKIANMFLEIFGLSYNSIEFDIQGYTKYYELIEIQSLDDINLINNLKIQTCKTFLFTGGGILKKKILSIENSKFIHIHPGVVPDIKGANGLFWSYLLRGKSGYSCFYMNDGIDTGDILHIDEYNIHKYTKDILIKYTKEEIYKYLLSYYDPLLRANTLLNLIDESIKNNKQLNNLEFRKQDPKNGRTYFVMHNKLRDFTISRMIKEMID